MKRVLKIAGLVVAGLVVVAAVLATLAFAGGSPIVDGARTEGVEVVKVSFVSAYVLDLDAKHVALVDAGADPAGQALRAALTRRQLGPEAVTAILLTHGDWDHTAGLGQFPAAQVMALEAEVPLIEGRELRGPLHSLRTPRPNGNKVTRILHDGDDFDISGTRVRVFAVPGHTKGSAAFLVRGVLFLGDSAEAAGDGHLSGGRWLFTENPGQNRAALRDLATRLAPSASDITTLACSHTGLLPTGLQPLAHLAQGK